MKNIKKLKAKNPLYANLGDKGMNPALGDDSSGSSSSGSSSSGGSSSGSSSSDESSSWWNVADSLGNTLISVFQGIVSPLLGGGSDQSVMIVEQKHNSVKFIVYGIIAIVLIVLLFKFLKK